jgi:hypothetical protein
MPAREDLMRELTHTLLSVLVFVVAPMPALAADPTPSIPVDIVSPSSVGEVVFPHRKHVEEFSLDCVTCHHETHAAVLDMPHPQYFADFWIDCKICHRADSPPLASVACSKCHPSSPKSVADQTLSSKVAIHRSCWVCHEPGTGEKATATCGLCHNRQRIAPSASAGAEQE